MLAWILGPFFCLRERPLMSKDSCAAGAAEGGEAAAVEWARAERIVYYNTK